MPRRAGPWQIRAMGWGWKNRTRADADQGAIVRLPVKGRENLVEIDSRKAPGKLSACGTAGANPSDFDLVALAISTARK